MELIEFKPTFSELLKLAYGEGPTCVDSEYRGSGQSVFVLIRTHDFEIQLSTGTETIDDLKCYCEGKCAKPTMIELMIDGVKEEYSACALSGLYGFVWLKPGECDKDKLVKAIKEAMDESWVNLYIAFRRDGEHPDKQYKTMDYGWNDDDNDEEEYRTILCDLHNDKTPHKTVVKCKKCKSVHYTEEMAIELIRPYMEKYVDETDIITRMLEEYFPKPIITKAAR